MREVDGSELTIVESGALVMRGVALSDWSTLPDSLKPALEAIALHGTEENFERVEKMSPEAFEESVDAIDWRRLIYMRTDGASAGKSCSATDQSRENRA
ncbi:MAG: hypothetical protein ACLRXB_11690 [Escherichia coli]